jgi:hypothetical protein
MKFILALSATLLLVGCEERYRYPCQDPNNWESAQCQKPQCEVSRTCPDNIFKDKELLKTVNMKGGSK